MGAAEDDALRQKSVRVLGDLTSDRRGRPRTTALRQKSIRVSEDGASDRRPAAESRTAVRRVEPHIHQTGWFAQSRRS